MTDFISLPKEIINLIAQYLTPEELSQFRQTCKLFYKVGAEASLLQPHYNRLRTLDPSLPAQLPKIGAPEAFKDAFEKIRDAQLSEIAFLASKHDITQHAYLNQPIAHLTSLQQLEERTIELDKINSNVIRPIIDENVNNQYNIFLDLNGAGITRIPVSLIRDPRYIQYWQNLYLLSCNDNNLRSLNLQGCTALQRLNCNKNKISNLNLKDCTVLKFLSCYDNQLTKLNLQGCIALKGVECFHNKLTSLNLQGLTALHTLECNDNQLTSLNLQGCTGLERLFCEGNELITLNLEDLTVLRKLNCSRNQLSTLNLRDLTVLKNLNCSRNQLTSVNFQGLTVLKTLCCYNNALTTLNLQDLSTLVTVNCSENPITSLNIKGCTNLESETLGQIYGVLFAQLPNATKENQQIIITSLGEQYTYANCLRFLGVDYTVTLFAQTTLTQAYSGFSSLASTASAYLPSFSGSNPAEPQGMKRALEKDIEDINEEETKELKEPERKKHRHE